MSTIEQILSQLLPPVAVAEIVERYGDGYSALFKAEEVECLQTPGMGRRGSDKLRAIKTLVKSLQNKKQMELINASSSKAVYDTMKDMQLFETEHVRVLYLNSKNHVMKWEDISIENVTAATMDIKCMFSMAVRLKASAIIVVHNHPSGDPEPSQQDINSTHRLIAAGALLNIPVLDHIVIGAGDYKSLAEEGLL